MLFLVRCGMSEECHRLGLLIGNPNSPGRHAEEEPVGIALDGKTDCFSQWAMYNGGGRSS